MKDIGVLVCIGSLLALVSLFGVWIKDYSLAATSGAMSAATAVVIIYFVKKGGGGGGYGCGC